MSAPTFDGILLGRTPALLREGPRHVRHRAGHHLLGKRLLQRWRLWGGNGGGCDGSGSAMVSGDANDADRGGVSSATKALPSTGGVLQVAGLPGLRVVVAGGLVARRITR
ncbi:MAG: hypothetical protein M3R38_09075 [Actinomycetota bacterium]|nr:hypothetical protein [Actinomycetota bacterium]